MKLSQSRVHFIGIGGIGMSGLAELLFNMGAQVSGSDLSENAQVTYLKSLGIKTFIGHTKENIAADTDVVVYSSAVKENNVEFLEARRNKIPLIARAEALAEIMRLKRGVAIAGTHGKTTTTSLTASIFIEAKKDPTIVVGGRLDLIKSTAKLGQGEWLVAEADESDGSFTRLSPELVVITNIDNDHIEFYKTFENLKKAFFSFASRIPFYGTLIICGDDPSVKTLFQNFPKKIIYYGVKPENDYSIKKSKEGYDIFKYENKETTQVGHFQCPLPGEHNALNALASILMGQEAGIDLATSIKGIENFQGVDRRFQHRGEYNGIDFYDDYGHHPTEVKAVLSAFKDKFPDRRLVVLFQPHRYSRTESCWDDFLNCFKNSDELFMLDIYPAGEKPIPGISTEELLKNIDHPKAHHLPEGGEALVRQSLQENDILLTLGAGNVWKWGEEILKK